MARDGVLGFRLSVEARKACCDVRKVRPLRRALEGAAVWITGLRREQSAGRGECALRRLGTTNTACIKVNPLADWSLERLEGYVAANDIPVNPLHARGFPSIGCQPCTRAILPGRGRQGRPLVVGAGGRQGMRPAQQPSAAARGGRGVTAHL